MTVEELIIDDSFINYCFKRNENDIAFWQNYLLQNPSEREKIEEARFFVTGLSAIIKTVKEPVNSDPAEANTDDEDNNEDQKAISFPTRFKINWAWAASVFLVLTSGVFILNQFKSHRPLSAGNYSSSETDNATKPLPNNQNEILLSSGVYATGIGEKKKIRLPDNTIIVLNAMTRLHVDKEFGRSNRNVIVDGEAMFDVTHNENLPFIVDAKNFTVKVLGTKFNIRSYEDDEIDEASLLRGKIELTVKNNHTTEAKLVLKPLQKVFVGRKGITATAVVSGSRLPKLLLNASTLELSKESEVKLHETAWVYDRFELEDDFFENIAAKLERKFGVNILFKDEFVKKYKYTATFEKENISEILMFLSSSLPFEYKIEGKTITIKK